MLIFNASFMIEREREQEFLLWLRAEIADRFRFGEPAGPSRPQLSAMRQAGGVDYTLAEAQTVAFQVEFESRRQAEDWGREHFADLAAAFEARYAPNAMVFTSIFEKIDL